MQVVSLLAMPIQSGANRGQLCGQWVLSSLAIRTGGWRDRAQTSRSSAPGNQRPGSNFRKAS